MQDLRFRARVLLKDAKLTARQEVDRVFGQDHASAHPEVVAVVLISASMDWGLPSPAKAEPVALTA